MGKQNRDEQPDVDKASAHLEKTLAAVRQVRMIVRILMLIGMLVPLVLFLLIYVWPFF
jgi:hypothetical protein